jgi:hypothetical protein
MSPVCSRRRFLHVMGGALVLAGLFFPCDGGQVICQKMHARNRLEAVAKLQSDLE